ncbi:MAG: RNA methyltransferase [Chloroflexi bacterium]|nr:RNA methyltransferase [Chloroflexota bacterium]
MSDALKAGVRPVLALYDEAALDSKPMGIELLEQLERLKIDRFQATSKIIEVVSGTVTPQGIVAAVTYPVRGTIDDYSKALLLVLDALQDPGNLGTILRSGEAAGATAVLLSEETVDPFNPKVVRAGMGAHFRLPILADLSWEEIREALDDVTVVRAAEIGAPQAYFQVDWTAPSALIIGNEAHGLSPKARSLATDLISIPMVGGAESLNAAVAASVILFEALRQRLILGVL